MEPTEGNIDSPPPYIDYMHSYTIDSEIRKQAVAMLAVVAVLVVWLISKIPTFHFFNIPISASISFGLVFGLLWLWFDLRLWKKLAQLGFLTDLNGTWEGKGISSYVDPETGKNVEYDISVLIRQTFSKIEISLATSKSSSKSTMSAMFMNHTLPRLVYSYENKPFVDADSDMQRHTGLQELTIDESAMYGEYFSGKHRVRTGSVNLTKKDAINDN